MSTTNTEAKYETIVTEDGQILQRIKFDFGMSRRGFVQALGAGIVIATTVATASGQRGANPGAGEIGARGGGRGFGGGGGPANLEARLHIGQDGIITVMSGKVEGGQGTRAEISQAAAEELRVPISQVRLILSDTGLCPDDGPSYGSQTTPRTLPTVRSNCAVARDLLVAFAAKELNVDPSKISFRDGAAVDSANTRKVTYAQLASSAGAADTFKAPLRNATVAEVKDWQVMGKPTLRPNGRDLVTGKHEYPSAIVRPGMLYGKVLRAPAYNAKLKSVDLSTAKAMPNVVVVQDGDFVAVAAPTTYQAKKAIEAIEKTAQWDRGEHVSSKDLAKWLRQHIRGGMPANPYTAEIQAASKHVKASYDIPYVQHTPMEPRSAVAEWENGKLTVWTGGQNPFGVRGELASALRVNASNVRVIINDFGGAFGGKHTGENAVEAARIAQAAGKPVSLRWTRHEEFTWAAFRSAAAIDIEATLDDKGTITSWHHVVVQGSDAARATPYRIARNQALNPALDSQQPLRLGSYRALGSTANVFARESFMDELALAAGNDPLEFRLAHLENPRLRAVLEDVAKRFDWKTRRARNQKNVGVGLACATEKASFVAACVEVEIDASNQVKVRSVFESFECGAIVDPVNLHSQVEGAIIQGLGPAIREAMEFEDGVMLNASFFSYKVPRFADLPEIQIGLLNRPDLPSVGAGETPLIAVGAAIANAVHHATGKRIRQMPVKLDVA